MKKNREESEVFKDLAILCSTPGYAHVIAFYCFKDSIIRFNDELTSKDMLHLYSCERLIRTEISTLIGLLLKNEVNLCHLDSDKMQYLIDKTSSLLSEIHNSMMTPVLENLEFSEVRNKDFNPFANGPAMREPIFYSSESAYNFQYLDFACKKYDNDNDWFMDNKGFTIKDAKEVIQAICDFQNKNFSHILKQFKGNDQLKCTMTPLFIFTIDEIVNLIKIDRKIVYNVLNAFTFPVELRNQDFNALNDFNLYNACPLIALGDGKYILYQQLSLAEALYESPFYWLYNDKEYRNTAMINRGNFTETFCKERLECIFGENKVFSNINIIGSGNRKAGEIDVLVTFADRAIILQAKSKRLTIEAKKGNDKVIKDDFKKSIQDSYNQAFLCSELISNKSYKLEYSNSKELYITRDFKEIYIFCVVSDNYPALFFQTINFLKYKSSNIIKAPFIMDIFLLDVMAEMLSSPLRFLSYINRRVFYNEAVMAPDELTVLSYHLHSNLWVKNVYKSLVLYDDIRMDLDVAMLVRREGLPGKETPKGILTEFKNTNYDKLIQEIEKLENPRTVNLGFMLLKLNGDIIDKINQAIDLISSRSRSDRKSHDISIGSDIYKTGLTIHSNYDAFEVARQRLEKHCKIGKYSQKAISWFGICLDPDSRTIKFGVELNSEWKWSKDMENALENMRKNHNTFHYNPQKKEDFGRKIGRNDPCPCASGKKYKKCCGDSNRSPSINMLHKTI